MKGRTRRFVFVILSTLFCGCYGSRSGPDAGVDTRPSDPIVDAMTDAGCTHPVCDIVPQCGCPDHAMCTLDADGERACVIEGSRDEGDTCSGYECAPGLVCDGGLCRRACLDSSDCSEWTECRYEVEGETVRLCTIHCEFLTNDGCPDAYKCDVYKSDESDRYLPDCFVPVDERSHGESCDHYLSCGHGSLDCTLGAWCYYYPIDDFGVCESMCPDSDFNTLSFFCPDAFPCCHEAGPYIVAGEGYYSCVPEAGCR